MRASTVRAGSGEIAYLVGMASVFKLTVHRWACLNGLSIYSAVLAHQAVLSAERVWKLSVCLREGGFDRLLPKRPDADRWLGMYRNHRGVLTKGWNAMERPEKGVPGAGTVLAESRLVSHEAQHHSERFKKRLQGQLALVSEGRLRRLLRVGFRQAHKSYKRHLEEVAAEIAGRPADEDLSRVGESLATVPEFYFLLRVWLPCLFEYCTFPGELLRQARQGDEDAIEKLLRLDDLAIHDRGIQAWVNGEGGPQRLARLGDASKWAAKLPAGQNSAWHFKQCVGGLISAMSQKTFYVLDRWGLKPTPLESPRIMDLFDALYRDREGRKQAVMTAPDFAEVNPESWAKAVQRYRKQWDRLLFADLPDKTSRG